ncbi:MAG: peptide deformylase [Campylobacterota bacterium]|nr:peptide deformylase [Campylobacterota bacterium]
MVRELVTYPDDRIDLVSADVRVFDEELYHLIDDMKETSEASGADGLAAIQIGYPSSVVVIKGDSGDYLEFINPRIIRKNGSVQSVERTLYLPDTERTINRYESISLIYQDREGNRQSLKADGALSLLIQRKFDYLFGGSFVTKMNPKARKDLEKELSQAGVAGTFDSSGPISKREYFKSMMNKLLFLGFLTLFAPLFNAGPETIASLYTFEYYVNIALILLNIGYFAYAKYEANRVVSCTGCQVVNFAAVSLRYFAMTMLLYAASHYLLRPV